MASFFKDILKRNVYELPENGQSKEPSSSLPSKSFFGPIFDNLKESVGRIGTSAKTISENISPIYKENAEAGKKILTGKSFLANNIISESIRKFLTPENEEEAKKQGLVKVPGGGYIDPFGAAGSIEDVGGKIIKQIAKEEAPEIISGLLKKIGNIADDLIPELSQKLAKITKPAEVENAIKEATSAITESTLLKEVPKLLNNVPDGMRQRGFITSVTESPNIPDATKKAVSLLPEETKYYSQFSDKEAVLRAQQRVSEGLQEAERYVLSADKMDKDVATTGFELMRRYRLDKNYEAEVAIVEKLAPEFTKAGQFIQASSILSKLSPEGILMYASKRMGKAGVKLQPALAEKLVSQVQKIESVAEDLPYQKFLETQELAGMIDRNIPKKAGEKIGNWLAELWTLPKSVAASYDVSAGLRQGLFPMYTFPEEWSRAFGSQFKALASEKGYAELMNSVMNNKYFSLANEAKIAFSDISSKLTGREDRFMSSLAEKIPVIGKGIRASDRAYTGFLNKLRMDMFTSMVETAKKLEVNIDDKWLNDTARFINDATGRGDSLFGAKVNGSLSVFLNGIMFSPRLMFSRLNLLATPATYLTANQQVRKQAWKSLLAYGAGTATILALADTIPGVDVGKDPRSADFGKIKAGNVRFDIMGGFQQYIRIAAQVVSGKYISTTTNKVITLGEGYKPLTRFDVLQRGLESKVSPTGALILTMMRGKNFEGEDIKNVGDATKELGKKFIPMALNDIWEVYKEDPKLLPFGFLGMLGVGVQAYPMTDAIEKMKEINASEKPWEEFEKLKKENPILAEKVKTAKLQESFTEFDWGLTYMGVESGERARFLVEYFSRMSNEEKINAWNDLRNKKLISDTVKTQIEYLLQNPDLELPKQ